MLQEELNRLRGLLYKDLVEGHEAVFKRQQPTHSQRLALLTCSAEILYRAACMTPVLEDQHVWFAAYVFNAKEWLVGFTSEEAAEQWVQSWMTFAKLFKEEQEED